MRYILKYLAFLLVFVILIMAVVLWRGRSDYYKKAVEASAEIGFNVQEIELYGRKNTTVGSIEAAIGIEKGYPIFAVDIKEVQDRLKRLAWVKSASVTRILPDKLVIEVAEHKPLAVWQNNGKHFIISSEGVVLSVSAKRFKELPIVIGRNAPEETPTILGYVDNHFPELKPRIKSVIHEGDRRWSLLLDDLQSGVVIKLPEDTPNAALEELAEMQRNDGLLDRNLDTVDMRMPDRMAVRFQKIPVKKMRGQDS